MEEKKDEKLWQMAKKRADFQNSLLRFVVLAVVLWGIWWVTAGRKGINTDFPWPIWPLFFIGIGLFIKFIKAYKTDKDILVEKEYEKLKKQNP